ncbi:unnamed protein product [Rhodiola kirilowii]
MAMGCIEKSLPFLAMVSVQVIHACVNLLSKLALDSGMEPSVFVTYRQISATVAITPFAIFLERNTWPLITRHILSLSLLCSVFGATLHQLLFFYGLQHSTPIISVASVNTLPAITFFIAVLFRQEKAMIRKMAGQAKIIGTCVCVGGATLLAFYHGGLLIKSVSKLHLTFAGYKNKTVVVKATTLGGILIVVSRVSLAIWLIIQTRLSRKFPAPFTNTMLLCLFSSVQCAVISVTINNDKPSAWYIKSHIQLVAVLYAGVISSAVGFWLIIWTAGKKGPLYVSVFGPLSLVVVAILGWALIGEDLFRGTLYGALLIMVGLYLVLWGKSKEQQPPEVDATALHAEPEGRQGELEMPNAVTITVPNKEHEEKL